MRGDEGVEIFGRGGLDGAFHNLHPSEREIGVKLLGRIQTRRVTQDRVAHSSTCCFGVAVAKVQPGQPEVIAMRELGTGQRTRLNGVNKCAVGIRRRVGHLITISQ